MAGWLPPGFHGVGLWHPPAWLLQPVAAVWCLRGTGEARLAPALGVALAALGTPAWLALALAGLGLLALSHRIGAGTVLLVDGGVPPGMLEQFRSSGHFFWPVAYALLVGTFAMLARLPRPTTGAMLVLALGALQFLDAAPLRADLRGWAAARQPWTVPAPALRGLFGGMPG